MERVIRVGIVGMGRAGRFMHIPELSSSPDKFRIVAVCDHDPERLQGLPPEVAEAKRYEKLEQLLADPNVDLVTIATRSVYHVDQAIAALHAGKSVVVEKPIAISMEQLERLVAADKEYPGKIFLRFNRRFEPAFMMLREIVAGGKLGRVNMFKIYRHVGFIRRLDWQTTAENYGGMLNNWGPHMIDQARCFLGGEISDVWCDLQHNVAAGDAEDQVKLLLKSPSGMVADIEIDTTVPFTGNMYELWGDRGALTVNSNGDKIFLRYLDPACKLKPLKAITGQFPLAYGNPDEKLVFKEETIDVNQNSGHTFQRGHLLTTVGGDINKGYTHQDTMWLCLYDAMVNGVPYPITMHDGYEVVRITQEAYRKSGYVPHECALCQ